MAVITEKSIRALWATPLEKRQYRAAGSLEDALTNLILGFRPTDKFFLEAGNAAIVAGGAQALADAGYDVAPISQDSGKLASEVAKMRKEIIARKLEPLAYSYYALILAARVGKFVAARNLAIGASSMVASILGPFTFGISTAVGQVAHAAVALQGAIALERLKKATDGFSLIAQLWGNELTKRRMALQQQQAQRVAATIEQGIKLQNQLQEQMNSGIFPAIGGGGSNWISYLPWAIVGLGAVALVSAGTARIASSTDSD